MGKVKATLFDKNMDEIYSDIDAYEEELKLTHENYLKLLKTLEKIELMSIENLNRDIYILIKETLDKVGRSGS